jgi:hypothetical protein
MPEILRLDGLLVKEEPAGFYGIDAVPVVGTDGLRLAKRMFNNIRVGYLWENDRKETASGSIIPVKRGIARGRTVRIEVFWEAKGAGIDAPPESRGLYIAGGLPEVDGTLMFDYGPVTSGTKGSATLYCYAAGKIYKVVGCRGRFDWPMLVGENIIHHFVMMGTMLTEPATLTLPGITYDATDPIALVNTALAIGSWVPDWQSATLDLIGVDPQALTSGNIGPTSWTDGIASIDFADVDPSFQIRARVPALATYDPYADKKANTSRNLALTAGNTQFNRIKVLAAELAIKEPIGHADSDGYADYDLNYQLVTGGILRFD